MRGRRRPYEAQPRDPVPDRFQAEDPGIPAAVEGNRAPVGADGQQQRLPFVRRRSKDYAHLIDESARRAMNVTGIYFRRAKFPLV
jgi:hypothetical protein